MMLKRCFCMRESPLWFYHNSMGNMEFHMDSLLQKLHPQQQQLV